MSQPEDLIAGARAGDRGAFSDLLEPLIEPAIYVALTVLGNRADAEDAVQEAAVLAWHKLDQLNNDGSLRAWFLAIVTNQSRMLRRRRWWSVLKLPHIDHRSAVSADQWHDHVELRDAISRLDRPARLVLFLYFGLDMTLEEVGAVIGLSRAGAKSRLYRAVHQLRPLVAEWEAPS